MTSKKPLGAWSDKELRHVVARTPDHEELASPAEGPCAPGGQFHSRLSRTRALWRHAILAASLSS
eukprot:5610653-Prorocentrum_lima.AAC.1